MGKGAPKIKASPMEAVMANIAQQQQARVNQLQGSWEDPLRGLMQPQIMQALGQNPFATSLSAAQRAPIEGQYNQAKRALMNTGTRGGQLNALRSGLERDRAGAISQAQNTARETGIQRALAASAGALPSAQSMNALQSQAAGGMNNVASMQNARNQAQSQANSQSSAGKGQLAGTLGKAALSAMSMMSSRDFKEDVVPYVGDPLGEVAKTPIYTWRYIGDSYTHIGPVTEESPTAILTSSGKEIDIINYLGLLLAAVKELTARVAALEVK